MTCDVVVHVKIVCNPLHGEVRRNCVTRYGWFSVECCLCREILISGKRFEDGQEQDLIWNAIRQHSVEHLARGDAKP